MPRTEQFFLELGQTAKLVNFSSGYRINDFDCRENPYNDFLVEDALPLHNECTSRTKLLINKQNADVIGYTSLCTGSIVINDEEKEQHDIEAPFKSMPTLKIGMLAIDKEYKGEGYGSLLIYLCRGIAEELLENGIACKFIDVDADLSIDGNEEFYKKNGFLENKVLNRSSSKTLSMRLDFLNYEEHFDEVLPASVR